MYYIKHLFLILILIVLLGGCASSPSNIPSTAPEIKVQDSNIQEPSIDNLVTLYQSALTELNNNNFETAEKYFLEITKTHPDFAGPWANLALIYIKQEHYEKAENYIQKSLEKNPEMAQALNMAGFIEERNGNINKARYYYEKAIEKKPDYTLAYYNLALLYDVYLQNIAEAIKHYQQYLSLLDSEDEKTEDWVEELKFNLTSNDT